MVIQWKTLSPFREVSGRSIAKKFYCQIFPCISNFWNLQEALNTGIGLHITEVRAKTLKKWVNIFSAYFFSLIFYKKNYNLDL